VGGQLSAALAKGRFQVGFGIALAVFIPAVVRSLVTASTLASPQQYNTVIGATFAIILAYISYRKINIFPGITSGGYIITSITIWFGILLFILAMFRMRYTTIQFMASYLISIAFFLSVNLYVGNKRRVVFGIVSNSALMRLPTIEHVEWHPIERPDEPLPELRGVVADLDSDHSDAWSSRIATFALEGIPVYHVRDVVENLTGMVQIRHLSENMLGSLNPNDNYLIIRNVVDTAVASLLLTLLSPLFCIVAFLIKLDSAGPVFFKQKRIGFRNRPFTVYKFRTMTDGIQTSDDRRNAMTRPNDPRITTVGSFLRKTRIDELPQLINVVKGEMGLIGPRPEAVALTRWYELEIPFYHYRHIIKPGITGWAQVNQGHVYEIVDVSRKLHLDFYYVKNISFWLDILIVLKTIHVMFNGTGAK
jgi:lipopolysaccharide/colanic/teichoic acid biosynthesis glycosyltransferase